MSISRGSEMNKIKTLFTGVLVALVLFSCEQEVPFNPLNQLDEATVTSPLAYLDGGVVQNNLLTFQCELPEDVAGTITSYYWEILDPFDEVVLISEEAIFELKGGLQAEEYKVVLVITDIDGFKRVFAKQFIVSFREVDSSLVIERIPATDDTGISDNDLVTSKNSGLTFVGTATRGSSVDVKIINASAGFAQSWPADVSGEGVVTALVPDTLADGSYEAVLIYSGQGESSSLPIYLMIDTQAPVLNWKNELPPASSFNWGDAVDSFGKATADEQIVQWSATGNYDAAPVLNNFDSYTSGAQTLNLTGIDTAGNASAPITRGLTMGEPDIAEKAVDGGFAAGTGSELGPVWTLRGSGRQFYSLISEEWGGWLDSTPGGLLDYGGSKWDGLLAGRSGEAMLFSATYQTDGTKWISRTRGHAWQTITVQKGVTYRAQVDTQFDNSHKTNHDCWNSIAVASAALGMTFDEGNIELLLQEEGFGAGTAVRVGRVASDSTDHINQYGPIFIDFTPAKSGEVRVGVIKSDISTGGKDNGASLFDNLSVKAFSWSKASK